MTGDNRKKANLTIRLDTNLLERYKSLCDKNGFDMSKRLRKFIEMEIKSETGQGFKF